MASTKIDLIRRDVASFIASHIEEYVIDLDEIADTRATRMIEDIQYVLLNTEDDFDIVEEIVRIFEENGISTGRCHDFG